MSTISSEEELRAFLGEPGDLVKAKVVDRLNALTRRFVDLSPFVLLAEAQVPYDQLVEMDEINPEFERTDVALVIGANDVTNPDARSNQGSPIYGMPILDVDKAQNVIVLKRSMRPGFAGVDNPLYTLPNTQMLFGDARESVVKLVAAVKAL